MFEWVVGIALVIIIILLVLNIRIGEDSGVSSLTWSEKTNEMIKQNSQIIRELEKMNKDYTPIKNE
jgi:hypothetical protein